MSVPPLIRVSRAERTPFIGRYSGGQQFLSLVAPARVGGQERLYTVLHTFDADGRHLTTRAEPAGDAADPQAHRLAERRQQEWLRQLPTLLLSGVEVEPFAVQVDGITFGLLVEGNKARLVPLGLVLGPPWDGSYQVA